jgi:chromosome segregation ATPase
MKKNDQNRNFTISSKVSSSQQAKYMLEAKRLNLSLSEWVCGTLDMSLDAYDDVNKISDVKQLQEEIDKKDQKINSLASRIEMVKSHLELTKSIVLKKDKIISELGDKIDDLENEIVLYRRRNQKLNNDLLFR